MEELQHIFSFKGSSIRTFWINTEAYFFGKDVAKVLGYKRANDAINAHIDEDDKLLRRITVSGQRREVYMINESGLYSLIISSKLPSAKEFKHWVTSEVLPTIRKHGAYMTPKTVEDALLNPDTIINLAQQIKLERAGRKIAEAKVTEMQPKALFADSVATSRTAILVGELAKILKGNGINIGANRLFSWLRANGYLISRKGTDWNMPTQKAMNLGLFKIKETAINHSDGTTSISKTPKITGKGQQYFVNRFLSTRRDESCNAIESY